MTQQRFAPRDATNSAVEAALRREIDALRDEIEHLRGSAASLREVEDRYREIAEQSSDVISRHHGDGTFVYASQAATAILGYKPHELMGMRVMDLIHPDDRDSALREFDGARRAGLDHATVVCRLRRKDGSFVWVESTDRFVPEDVDAESMPFHAVTRDITKRKAAEDALRASEERFRSLAEQSHDLISRHSSDGTFTYASSASRALLGYEPDELVGQLPRMLMHPDDAAAVIAAVNAAMTGAPSITVSCRLRHKDGRYIWFESTDTVTRDADGAVTGIHSITRDTSARKATEDALRTSEERFRRVFELSRVGIAFVGDDARFLRANQALCDMVEYTEDELRERTVLDITHPDDVALSQHAIDELRGDAHDVGIEKRYITKSGRIVWVSMNATIMPREEDDTTGDPPYNLAIIEEITHRKNAEEELRRLASLKSEFLALASHELRAPLTNISGGLEVIGEDAALLPPASRRAVEIVSAETLRLNRLVESILDISRLDAGQLPLVLGPVALEPLLRRAADSPNSPIASMCGSPTACHSPGRTRSTSSTLCATCSRTRPSTRASASPLPPAATATVCSLRSWIAAPASPRASSHASSIPSSAAPARRAASAATASASTSRAA